MNEFLTTLQKMADDRYSYDLGDWWNAVDLAIEEIEVLQTLVNETIARNVSLAEENGRLRTLIQKDLNEHPR